MVTSHFLCDIFAFFARHELLKLSFVSHRVSGLIERQFKDSPMLILDHVKYFNGLWLPNHINLLLNHPFSQSPTSKFLRFEITDIKIDRNLVGQLKSISHIWSRHNLEITMHSWDNFPYKEVASEISICGTLIFWVYSKSRFSVLHLFHDLVQESCDNLMRIDFFDIFSRGPSLATLLLLADVVKFLFKLGNRPEMVRRLVINTNRASNRSEEFFDEIRKAFLEAKKPHFFFFFCRQENIGLQPTVTVNNNSINQCLTFEVKQALGYEIHTKAISK
ncbi:hypothetical protein Ddc_16572 [Ditylenchus destructor]|nr:hypothetical protein Ddc_16572 [Ditylenchus destructor]